jgi:tetratricopeptide (TPR) repeat protein
MSFYEEFLKERKNDPTLTADLLHTRLKVAGVLRELGQSEKARETYATAAAGFEQALRERPDAPDLKAGLAEALVGYAPPDKADENVTRCRRAIALREEVLKARPGDLVNKRWLAEVYNSLHIHLGWADTRQRRNSLESVAACERCAMLLLELAEASPDDPDILAGLARTFNNIAGASRAGKAGNQVLPLYQRAMEFERESLRLRPNDASMAIGLRTLTDNVAGVFEGMWRYDEAAAETRSSVETLRTLARANPDTPAIQEAYLRSSQNLAYRLTDFSKRDDAGSFARCVDEAVRALLEPVGAFDRLSRETGDSIADVAEWRLVFARFISRIKADLTPEQKAARDALVDRAVGDYREAVARGAVLDLDSPRGLRLDSFTLRKEAFLKDHPAFATLVAEVEAAAKARAGRTAVAGTAPTTAQAPRVSPPKPKVDVRLGRATLLSALGLARGRARDAQGEEALATLDRARILFDELARERPGDAAVERGREQVRLNILTALDALARSSLQAGRAAEAAGYRRRAQDLDADAAEALDRDLSLTPRKPLVSYWTTPIVSMMEETHVANDAVFDKLARLRPRDPFIYVCRADALARRGDWAGVAAAMKTLLALDPDNYTYWYVASVAFPRAGDLASYRWVCREMLTRFKRSDDLDVSMWSAMACVTLPDAVDDYREPTERAERALGGFRARGAGDIFMWPEIAAAAVDYRAGRFEAAVARLSARKPESYVDSVTFGTSRAVLAMAYHRLGRTTEARRELVAAFRVDWESAAEAEREVPLSGFWHDQLRYNLLRHEAEALILDPDFPPDPFAR